MVDQDRLYVSEGVLPVYKSLVRVADLIVPNQFEAELLSGVKVDSLTSLSRAISELHRIYNVPHVIITSVTFTNGDKKMLCAGSSATSSGVPRKFMFNVEIIDGFFSGTGDMFAALTLARFREEAEKGGLEAAQSWRCDDAVGPLELPLCKAIGRVLGSMHLVLVQTQLARDRVLGKKVKEEVEVGSEEYVRLTKASELRLVQCQSELKDPQIGYEAVVLK
jgi:pyridoxine kinase